jgi:hypothetical protein
MLSRYRSYRSRSKPCRMISNCASGSLNTFRTRQTLHTVHKIVMAAPKAIAAPIGWTLRCNCSLTTSKKLVACDSKSTHIVSPNVFSNLHNNIPFRKEELGGRTGPQAQHNLNTLVASDEVALTRPARIISSPASTSPDPVHSQRVWHAPCSAGSSSAATARPSSAPSTLRAWNSVSVRCLLVAVPTPGNPEAPDRALLAPE